MHSVTLATSMTSVFSRLFIAQAVGITVACAIAATSDAWMDGLFVFTVVVQAIVAAVSARVLGMAMPWIIFNFLFVPTLLGTLHLDIDPLLYGIGFLLLLGVYGTGAAAHRIPLYLTGQKALSRLERWLPEGSFSMLDIGAGTGRVLRFVAQRRGGAKLYGVETAPLPFLLAWLRSIGGGFKVSYADFWNSDLSRHDVVYAYLSPAPMERLWQKAQREMRPGSLFISNSFAVPGVRPHHVVRYGESSGAVLRIWRM